MIFFLPLQLFAQTIDGIIKENEYSNTSKFDNGLYTLSWSKKGDIVYFALSAETTGWVAIGIDPTTIMEHADMIFGWVDDTGKAHVVDAFATGPYGPHPSDESLGGKTNILDFAGTEQNGITTIEFSRKIDTKDRYDKIIHLDTGNKIIWSYGASDDIYQYHKKAGYGWLGAGEGPTGKKGSGLLLVTHNITLTISFLMIVWAMLVARYLKKRRWWLKVHKNLMLYGVGLGIIGIISAEYLLFSTSVGHFRIIHSYFGTAAVFTLICTPVIGQLILKGKRENKPFFRILHRWVGRAALIMTFISIVLGLFRINIL
jgi:hypothetical protein